MNSINIDRCLIISMSQMLTKSVLNQKKNVIKVKNVHFFPRQRRIKSVAELKEENSEGGGLHTELRR